MATLEELANGTAAKAPAKPAKTPQKKTEPKNKPTAAELLSQTLPATGTPSGNKRSETLSASRKAKMDEIFKGRKFEVEKPVNLTKDQAPFITPLGNKGRAGFIIKDLETGARCIVGATTLQLLADVYKAVTLPVKPPRVKKDPTPRAEPTDPASLGL